jgi:cation transport protein ChaC
MTAPTRLTREMLLDGGLEAMIARLAPEQKLLTAADRHASLQATLAARPEGGDGVWLFAYGSLIWNPTVEVTERRLARVHGWHRAFCLTARAGRGTPENPGLLLGLREGGACVGAALRLAEAGLEAELDVLWRREMITAAYRPRWLAIEAPDGGGFGHALAFTIDATSHAYAGELDEAEVVARLATAGGLLGSCADYLFQTCAGLTALGIDDPAMERIAAAVRARLAAAV